MSTQVGKLSVSIHPKLIEVATEIAKENNISRSKVVSDCLRELDQKREAQLMEEGYKAMAKENREFAKTAFELQRRAVPEWK